MGDLAKVVNTAKDENFLLECLGIMSNLNFPDLDWCEIFKHFNMLAKLKDILKSNNAEPDLLLQVIFSIFLILKSSFTLKYLSIGGRIAWNG